MADRTISQAARTLAAAGASKGGRARAKKLSPAQRRESARKAAQARWGMDLPVAAYGAPDRPLRISGPAGEPDIEIPCYVLEDDRRVLVQGGALREMDMSQGAASRGAGDRLVRFVATKALSPFVPQGLADVITNPIRFRVPNGGIADGYEATVLADLCDAVLEARKQGKLNYQQEHIADRCEILVRGFARVGIIALVDEATGYQEDRARDALADILKQFIPEELREWVKTFPDAYFRELARLKQVPLSRVSATRPQWIGHITNDIVYKRLTPGVLQELKRITPKTKSGHRAHKSHQRLTQNEGHPKLREHLASVITLMKACNDWDTFKKLLNRALPRRKEMPLFPNLEEVHHV